MAIDLSQVTAIHIPEGDVTKIECNGVILWELTQGKVVESITLAGYTTTFNYGATWVYGGTVTANYSDGTTADVTSSTSFSGYNTSSAGTQTVTATYTEDGVTVTATYQITVNPQQFTISYRKVRWSGTAPATKTVNSGYALTSADLPTQNDSTNAVTTGWTYNGTTLAKVGDLVTSNITLYQVQKVTVTSGNLFKKSIQTSTGRKAETVTATVSMGNVGNSTSGSTTKTYALSQSKSLSFSSTYYYKTVGIGAWGGNVTNFTTLGKFRVEWTPSLYQVTFTRTNLSYNTNNYQGTYPTLVVRHEDTGGFIYSKTQNNTNKISYTCNTMHHSGSSIRLYIQHGGNDGGQKLAWSAGTRSEDTSATSNITCNKSTCTETIYIYALPE